MKKKIEEFIKWTKANGWSVKRNNKDNLYLSSEICSRYSNVSEEYMEFLKTLDVCISPDEKSWFICLKDYNEISDTAYSWDEIEKMSLNEAEDDDEWKKEIIDFWNKHLPIVLSVRNGYEYYALDIRYNVGSVVHGYEPDFEEVEMVAPSFNEFVDVIMNNIIDI